MTLRSFAAWFLSLCIPFSVIVTYHPEFNNWWVMGSLIAAFSGGMLAQATRVRTVTRYVVALIEVRRDNGCS